MIISVSSTKTPDEESENAPAREPLQSSSVRLSSRTNGAATSPAIVSSMRAGPYRQPRRRSPAEGEPSSPASGASSPWSAGQPAERGHKGGGVVGDHAAGTLAG